MAEHARVRARPAVARPERPPREPTGGPLRVTSAIPEIPPEAVLADVDGLPPAVGYDLHVKYLRYRERPHLSAWTDFEDHSITIQVPEPFLPFGEVVAYAARRRPGRGRMRFIWLTEGITFHTPREVIRFLYCHEWMHARGTDVTGRQAIGETACDRFALFNYCRDRVTIEDAVASVRWRNGQPRPGGAATQTA